MTPQPLDEDEEADEFPAVKVLVSSGLADEDVETGLSSLDLGVLAPRSLVERCSVSAIPRARSDATDFASDPIIVAAGDVVVREEWSLLT